MNKPTCVIEYNKKDTNSDALKKFYKNLEKHHVTVGIHRADGQEVIGKNNFTLIKNACIQEFGNTQIVENSRRFKSPYTGKWFYLKAGTEITIPPRVFIRIFTEKRLQKKLTEELRNVIHQNKFKDAETVYKNIGDYARLTMKMRFLDKSIKPKNAPMTVEYKGFNDPLNLTGRMANSIKSEVH